MKTPTLILTLIFLLLLPSCGDNRKMTLPQSKETNFEYAENISMKEIGEGVTLVTLKNPWDTLKNIDTYALIDKGGETPKNLPQGTKIIRVPLENSVVYSGVHVSLIDELGAFDAVKGVCDVEYIHDNHIKEALSAGKIQDCGLNTSPNVERIISLKPEAVLLSPYESMDASVPFTNSGLTLIQTVDYMERTPLGRAEWMRFYGRLYGKGEEADSLFNKVKNEYEQIRNTAVKAQHKPVVLFDRIYSGLWDVPTSRSVTGNLIKDAGGSNPFENYEQGGAARLAPEEVLLKGANADIWLIRYIEPELTLSSLAKDNSIYTKFKAYKQGNVYGSNTLKTNLFEDGAFHPNLTLKELVSIIHPSEAKQNLNYYIKLK